MAQFISIVLLSAHIIWQTSMAFRAVLKYSSFKNAASEHMYFAVNMYRAHQMLLSPVIPLKRDRLPKVQTPVSTHLAQHAASFS